MKIKSIAFALFTVLSVNGVAQTGVPRIVINAQGHSDKVENVLFTPAGDRLISISDDKTIRVWNANTAELLKKFESQIGDGPEGMLYASALSPDGKLLAVSGYPVATEKQNYIVIIDLIKGIQVNTAVGHTNVINGLDFSSTGGLLVSGSDDGTVKVWRVTGTSPLQEVTTLQVGSPVKSISLNSKTLDLAVAAEGRTEILVYGLAAIDRGSKIPSRTWKKHKGELNKVAYAPDGTFLASTSFNNEMILWRLDGTVEKEFDGIDKVINAIAFSYDSKLLVALDVAGHGVSYGLPAGNKFSDYRGHDNTVFCAAFSPSENGSYIVASAGGTGNEIVLWNPINGKTIRRIKGKGSAIHDLAFGPGLELFISRVSEPGKPGNFPMSFDLANFSINRTPGRYVPPASDANAAIRQSSELVLNLPKGKSIQNDLDDDGRIMDFQTTRDGNIVVASDHSLKLYDKAGLLQKEFVGHSGEVRALAVSEDGRYLASGGEDQSIIIWKLNESGAAPSLRKVFSDESWDRYFSALPVDSLTKEPSKKAWMEVIDFLKANGDKTYKGIEEMYKNLGESVLPFATLFISDDLEWVCWTPKGYFNCTSFGGRYFGWHVNRGIQKLADYYSAEQYFEILYRPKHMEKSMVSGKRIEDILKEEGERIFDLGRLHRPSAGLFDTYKLISSNAASYKAGKLITKLQTLSLDVAVTDGGGGVKEVNIYHNDKLVMTDREVPTRGEGESFTKSYKVDVTNGDNEYKVVVLNYQKIESRPEVITVEYVGELLATSSLHILAIGINNYMNSSYNLNYAQPDAKSFVDKLTSPVNQRIFKSINKVEIYNEQATKENIIKGFRSIIERAKPEDVFVFFYAGHGSLDEDNKDADGDSPFYFVPTDVTKLYGDPEQLQKKGLSGAELRKFLTEIRSTKQIVLMDACHSGGALKGINVRAAGSDEKAIVQLARSSGVVWIASSGTKQFATEFEVLKHGVFTYALLEALSGENDNGDSKVTVNELKLYMEERVPELTKKYGGQAQYPTGYINGNDFPISVILKR